MSDRKVVIMYPNLLAELKRHEKDQEALGNLLGLSLGTVNQKLNGYTDFKLVEVKKIQKEWFSYMSLEELFQTREEIDLQNEFISRFLRDK